jgi:hypothetical protein
MESENMITREELKKYAKIRNLNLSQAEEDYFQNILLFIIYQEYGKSLIFKGGTALSKCYGSNRFSEDLGFTGEGEFNANIINRGLKRFKIEFETEMKKYPDELKITLRIKGPLYVGIRQSLCRFIIDMSFRENILLPPEIKTIGRFLEEIPEFDVFVMQEKEILAEKIRAVLTRTKAKDVYDIWFLLKRGIEFDEKLIKEKLKFYNMTWNKKEFAKTLNLQKSVWENELKPLLPSIPPFMEVKKFLLKNLN